MNLQPEVLNPKQYAGDVFKAFGNPEDFKRKFSSLIDDVYDDNGALKFHFIEGKEYGLGHIAIDYSHGGQGYNVGIYYTTKSGEKIGDYAPKKTIHFTAVKSELPSKLAKATGIEMFRNTSNKEESVSSSNGVIETILNALGGESALSSIAKIHKTEGARSDIVTLTLKTPVKKNIERVDIFKIHGEKYFHLRGDAQYDGEWDTARSIENVKPEHISHAFKDLTGIVLPNKEESILASVKDRIEAEETASESDKILDALGGKETLESKDDVKSVQTFDGGVAIVFDNSERTVITLKNNHKYQVRHDLYIQGKWRSDKQHDDIPLTHLKHAVTQLSGRDILE